MEGIKKFVDDAIASKPVVVFSKSFCPYCAKVRSLFGQLFLEMNKPADDYLVIHEIEDRPDCKDIQTYLKELTGASSVPRVFIKGKSIGGCDDTFKIQKTGELEAMLKEL